MLWTAADRGVRWPAVDGDKAGDGAGEWPARDTGRAGHRGPRSFHDSISYSMLFSLLFTIYSYVEQVTCDIFCVIGC